MATKPENTFIAGVHRYLPPLLYHVKMNNPYVGGIPDVWYSGDKTDLWIEYKYIPRIPKSASILAALTPLQAEWLLARNREGRNLAVIVGCPDGGVFMADGAWGCTWTPHEFRDHLSSRLQLATVITNVCMRKP